jgi:hypothetical protein
LWRGWATTENADAYERFLLSELFPQCGAFLASGARMFCAVSRATRLRSSPSAWTTAMNPEKVAALERTERGEVEHGGLGIAAGA